MRLTIDLVAPSEEISTIVSLAREAEGLEEVTEPSETEASRALNAGLTADDVRQIFEVVTLVFNTGAALLAFLTAVREDIKTRGVGDAVGVSDTATGKPLGRVEAQTSDAALAEMAR